MGAGPVLRDDDDSSVGPRRAAREGPPRGKRRDENSSLSALQSHRNAGVPISPAISTIALNPARQESDCR